MAITDELREYAHDCCARVDDAIHAIADRIDAEHAEAQRRWMAELDAARDRDGYIELPKDVDGEYIHIGDAMEWVRYEDDDPTIVRKVSAVGAGVFFAWSDEQGRYAQYEAHAYRHHKQPTVEGLLRQFLGECESAQNLGYNEVPQEVFAEYAKRLKLAGEYE